MTRTASTAGKYSNGGRMGRRMCVRIGHRPMAGTAGRTPDSRRRTGVGQPVTWANPQPQRSGASCRLVTTRPAWRAMSARDCCRTCKQSSRAGSLGGPVHSQEPATCWPERRVRWRQARRAGSARRADGVRPARGLLVRCAAQAQGRAVAQPCAPGLSRPGPRSAATWVRHPWARFTFPADTARERYRPERVGGRCTPEPARVRAAAPPVLPSPIPAAHNRDQLHAERVPETLLAGHTF